jgi:hypothetical protein
MAPRLLRLGLAVIGTTTGSAALLFSHNHDFRKASSIRATNDRIRMSMMRVAEHQDSARTLCATTFVPGAYWVWLYRDKHGNPSSWERYSVEPNSEPGSDSTVLTISMETRFSETDAFQKHHQMEVDVAESLAAPTAGHWQLQRFWFKGMDGWEVAPHRDNVQAFEEKFDTHTMARDLELPSARVLATSQQQETTKFTATAQPTMRREIRALGGNATLTQTSRHRHTNAWFVIEPRARSGIAAYKEFGDHHTFELIESGRH